MTSLLGRQATTSLVLSKIFFVQCGRPSGFILVTLACFLCSYSRYPTADGV